MNKKMFVLPIFGIIILGFCIWFMLTSSSNGELALSEIKAYFRHTVNLNFHPDLGEISEVQIGGAISMLGYESTKYGNAIYNKKQHMEQITDYLNTISLVESMEDELPNKSPDVFIQYFDDKGNLIKNFIIYGQVFIKDVNNKKLYRIKKPNIGIIKGLEKLDFD